MSALLLNITRKIFEMRSAPEPGLKTVGQLPFFNMDRRGFAAGLNALQK